MLEKDYNTSSVPLPSFFMDMIGDKIEYMCSDKINSGELFGPSNFEHGLRLFNEILAFTDNDNSTDSEEFEIEEESDNEASEEIKDEIIDYLEQTKFSPCVIIDFIDGKFQRCGNTENLRQLRNLFGTWQVDRDAIKEVDGVLSKLGVCCSHFQFDNKYLHKSQNKQLKNFEEGIIQWRRCISCDKYVTFFSRGTECSIHSWNLNKKNIQIPCIGQYACDALRTCLPLCKRVFDNITKPQFICCSCYENLGGHIFRRSGRGKKATTCITEKLHADDVKKGIEFLANWLIDIAQTEHEEIKKNILTKTFETLLPFIKPFTPSSSNSAITTPFVKPSISPNSTIATHIPTVLNEPPSLFMIKFLFIKVYKKEVEEKLEIEDFEEFGRALGQKLWNSRSYVNSRKVALESPKTIQEYYDGFPEFLNKFFFGMIDELCQKKVEVCNWQRKRRHELPKVVTSEQIIKIVTFITSMLLGLAFPHLKVWLPRILASLGRMPKLLGSFRQLLTICHVSSHSDRHERNLTKFRMERSNPLDRLIQGNNVWNLAVIDNIDFKEKTFKFGNIYDTTRDSSHATLRMAFQARLPIEIETGPEQVIELTADTPLFGMNQGINKTLIMFQQVIYELLDFKEVNDELIYETNFDAETIKFSILDKLDQGCLGPSPNVVILEPGANPNSDEEILHVSEMYKEDFALKSHSFLDIVADEAIFRRLIKCREKWPNIRPLLGQWHTSKEFCLVLLVLFSSYGLLSLASSLGVRFLDKFEGAVDYRSTARVLDLLWAAVGIAINIYIKKNGILLSEIMDDENDDHVCLKVWYLFYRWTGIWKAHRMGMRVGNFGLQKDSLSAASPLYASAGKSNYTTAIAHYLSIIAAHPKLEERLHHCGAFKIPRDLHEDSRHTCFGFDEALETFGVKFIKQNICGNVIDEKSLKEQIKSSQNERERIDLLLSEYLNDNSISHGERAINSRKESLWKLVDDLVTVFGMPDPLSHRLFKEYTPIEMNREGLSKLFNCYPNGLERIKSVYRQEVLKTENRNPQGRRAIGVAKTKVKDYNDLKKQKNEAEKRTRVIPEPAQRVLEENSNEKPPTTESQPKQRKTKGTKRRTTKDETEILCALKIYKNYLPDDAIASVREKLPEVWTVKKVREWWNYHKNK